MGRLIDRDDISVDLDMISENDEAYRTPNVMEGDEKLFHEHEHVYHRLWNQDQAFCLFLSLVGRRLKRNDKNAISTQ